MSGVVVVEVLEYNYIVYVDNRKLTFKYVLNLWDEQYSGNLTSRSAKRVDNGGNTHRASEVCKDT